MTSAVPKRCGSGDSDVQTGHSGVGIIVFADRLRDHERYHTFDVVVVKPGRLNGVEREEGMPT